MYYLNLFKKRKDDSNNWLFIFILFWFILFKIISSWYFLKVVALLFLFVLLWVLYSYFENKRKDRPVSLWSDFLKKYPIIVQYWPPKWINPAEAGLLYNLKVDPTDLTSLVYQWKFEWLIDVKIFLWEKSGTKYVKLIKKFDISPSRPLFETEIFNSIFMMWNTKIIEWAFQLRYALMLEDLEFHWIKKWWIVKKTFWKYRKIFYKFLVLLLFVSVILYFAEFVLISPNFWFLVLLLLFVCIFFWWFINGWNGLKLTEKWAELASHLIWYRNFIKSCDEEKIKLLLKEDPLFVDRTLPYATAFWMETEFLQKISPLRSEWTAKYAYWKKVLPWIWILRLLFRSDDNDF